jgi:hypothetical protein
MPNEQQSKDWGGNCTEQKLDAFGIDFGDAGQTESVCL